MSLITIFVSNEIQYDLTSSLLYEFDALNLNACRATIDNDTAKIHFNCIDDNNVIIFFDDVIDLLYSNDISINNNIKYIYYNRNSYLSISEDKLKFIRKIVSNSFESWIVNNENKNILNLQNDKMIVVPFIYSDFYYVNYIKKNKKQDTLLILSTQQELLDTYDDNGCYKANISNINLSTYNNIKNICSNSKKIISLNSNNVTIDNLEFLLALSMKGFDVTIKNFTYDNDTYIFKQYFDNCTTIPTEIPLEETYLIRTLFNNIYTICKNKPKKDKKKVALCLSGFLRNADEAYPYIKANIIDKFNPDVFIHSYNNIKSNQDTDTKFKKKLVRDNISPTDVIKLYNPVKYVYDDYTSEYTDNVLDSNYDTFKSLILDNQDKEHTFSPKIDKHVNGICMFYKIKKCNELKQQYEKDNKFKYDIVIRMRFDQLIYESIDNKYLSLITKNVVIGAGGFCMNNGMEDQIAISDSETSDIYSNVYNTYLSLVQDIIENNYAIGSFPETVLYYYLAKLNNIKCYLIPLRIRLKGKINMLSKCKNFLNSVRQNLDDYVYLEFANNNRNIIFKPIS